MSPDGLKTCPHCRAIVQSTRCSICGKATYEDVAPAPPRPKSRWSDGLEEGQLRRVVTTLLAGLVIAAGTLYIVTRPDPLPDANALPPPPSTTADPRPTSTERPPSLVGGALPTEEFTPGAPREVDEGLSPWETPPPVDVVTGQFLDERLDYAADIARVAELLSAFPEVLAAVPLDPPELATFGGPLDAAQVEATQPFAARTLQRADGTAVGELWLVASAGSVDGDAYLTAARERWNADAAIDQYSPEVGLRLLLLAAGETTKVWAGDLDDTSMIVVQAPTSVDPAVLADALRAWRQAVALLD